VTRPQLEVAEVFRRYGPAYRQEHRLPRDQHQVMRAIERCRTAALGGHIDKCDHCGHLRISYNSCRNRHCPKCPGMNGVLWLEKRQAELLPVDYFHVVFTLPEAVAELAWQNKRALYGLLFQAAAQSLQTIAADARHLGAEIGFLAVLHTWGQNLLHHPHLHCLAPGGGLSPDRKRWVACRPGFFLPVRVLSRLFRRLFLEGLEALFRAGQLHLSGTLQRWADRRAWARLLAQLRQVDWVVYAKPPFAGQPAQVLQYLGRYTHRVAIANQRLRTLQDGQVTFQWRDYRHPQHPKRMCLQAAEFIRRFLLHVLPSRFQRIRYYGLLSPAGRRTKLALCRSLLGALAIPSPPAPATYQERYEKLTGRSLWECPVCHRGCMRLQERLPPSSRFQDPVPYDSS
jgi:hypothetical protein